MRFLSDNAASACPEVMAAIVAANEAGAGYDGDRWSARLDATLSGWFERPCRTFAVGTGTAANALALAVLCPPYGAVACASGAHIDVDECGAPEFFTGGAKLVPLAAPHGRLAAATLEAVANSQRGDVHQMPIRCLSLSQATEAGTVYTPADLAGLIAIARARGWRVHLDGARFANAVAHLRCAPGDLAVGVDALALGCVKNGGLGAEALVLFDPALAEEVAYRRKRAGHTPSKGRFRAAELLAMIETGAWARNAAAANAGARKLGEACGARLIHPVEANEVFVRAGAHATALRAAGFAFYDWPQDGAGAIRLVVSWDQPAHEIAALAAALAALPAEAP